jgi:hypothetical protein
MSGEENKTLVRRMLSSAIEEAMAEAQRDLQDEEVAEYIHLTELALQGHHVIRWTPPGLSRPVCAECGRVGQFYQWVATGRVTCRCQFPA